MRNVWTMLGVIVLSTCLSACGGGGGIEELPDPSAVLAVSAGEALRIHAGPGSADAGTIARAIAGATGQATVAADGGFTFDAIPGNAASTVSQATLIRVEYTKQGAVLTLDCSVTPQSSRVIKPLFSTGSAPNDMIFGNDSLYVANSMDNTVVRHGLDGTVLATASFSEYSSPSYLGPGSGILWVAANGSNMLTGLDSVNLAVATAGIDLAAGFDPAPAFPGPGALCVSDSTVYIPMSMIATFSDTTGYAEAVVLSYDDAADFHAAGIEHVLSGRNGKACLIDATTGNLLVTSAGEMQFDESWSPFVTTDSYLDIFVPDGAHTAVNLGLIGAGNIAVDPDGSVAYIGNALNGNLYKVDLESMTVARGEDNPIVLTTDFTYVSDVAFTPDGKYVLATSFNTDELYVIDAATDTVNPGPYPAPFDLSLDPELMAGCLGVEVNPAENADGGYSVYVLYAIANAVAKVRLF